MHWIAKYFWRLFFHDFHSSDSLISCFIHFKDLDICIFTESFGLQIICTRFGTHNLKFDAKSANINWQRKLPTIVFWVVNRTKNWIYCYTWNVGVHEFLWWISNYVMWSSKMSRNSQILFLRYSQTKPIVSFVSYCLFDHSTVCIFGTNYLISVGFSPN